MSNNASSAAGFWVGVDLAQDSLQISRAPIGLEVSLWSRLPQIALSNTAQGRDQLAGWIAAQAVALGASCRGIVVEATGGLSRRFAQALEQLGGLPPVSIVNPFFVKSFGRSLGQRSKNDKLDAAVLAVFGAVQQPAPAAALTPAQERLRELDRLRQGVVQHQTAWKNSLREARDPLARRVGEQQIKLAAKQIEELGGRIAETIAKDDDLRRQHQLLDSVPGIGPCLAATILAELGDLSAYHRDALVGYVGLFSREKRSGKRQGRGGGLVKGGGARVRRALGLAAMAVVRSNQPIKEFGLRLVARGKTKMCALTALMRKLLLIARAIVVSGKPYNPAEALREKPKRRVAHG